LLVGHSPKTGMLPPRALHPARRRSRQNRKLFLHRPLIINAHANPQTSQVVLGNSGFEYRERSKANGGPDYERVVGGSAVRRDSLILDRLAVRASIL